MVKTSSSAQFFFKSKGSGGKPNPTGCPIRAAKSSSGLVIEAELSGSHSINCQHKWFSLCSNRCRHIRPRGCRLLGNAFVTTLPNFPSSEAVCNCYGPILVISPIFQIAQVVFAYFISHSKWFPGRCHVW